MFKNIPILIQDDKRTKFENFNIIYLHINLKDWIIYQYIQINILI